VFNHVITAIVHCTGQHYAEKQCI